MTGALFVRRGPTTYEPTELSRGPWDAAALHGGPVAALLTGIADRHESLVPMSISRITVELVRPVPLEPLEIVSETVREGKKVQLVDLTVEAAGVEVTRARVMRQRRGFAELPLDEPYASLLVAEPAPSPGPGSTSLMTLPDGGSGAQVAYHSHATDSRFVSGCWDGPGPVTAWIRLKVPVVEGEESTPAQRVAAVADYGNGISYVLPFERYLFLNPDLSIHLLRDPVGEWIAMDTTSHIDSGGTGMAESALYDETGRIGRSVQSLHVERR